MTSDVLVIGEALIDIVETGSRRVEHVGGSPANVALGLGRRGVPVALLTQLADDARGLAIAEHLRLSGVNVLAESFTLAKTSTAEAHVSSDGTAAYEFDIVWGAIPAPSVTQPRVLHTGSIAAFLQPGADDVRRVLSQAAAEHITFDPNIRAALVPEQLASLRAFEETASLATTVKMSDEDASFLYPSLAPDEVLRRVLDHGPALAVITLGGEGALLASRCGVAHVTALPVTLVDTIGAGDTFMASLIHSLLRGASLADVASLERLGLDAVRAAAVTVSRPGADLPWAHEL